MANTVKTDIVCPMKRSFTPLIVLSLVAFSSALVAAEPAPPASRVNVTFVSPESFTDFTDDYLRRDSGQEHLMKELRNHIAFQARYLIPEGQRLDVRFIDVDLAGDFEPGRGPHMDRIRLIKSLYSPKMVLEFQLVNADGTVALEGRRELRELGYLMFSRFPTNDSLRYDKALLTDWMRSDFRRAKS